jgi:hypothetical protein
MKTAHLCVLGLGVVVSFSIATGSTAAGDASKPAQPLTTVSDLLMKQAKQHANEGRRLEQVGDYRGALKEYQAAVAERPVNDNKIVEPLKDDPNVFLIRASAELDAARVMSRTPGHDPKAVAGLLWNAEGHFSKVLAIVQGRPVSPENQSVTLLQKATLGRAYVRLMTGNLTTARADLQSASERPGAAAPQFRGALAGLDQKIAEQSAAAKTPGKGEALVKLGVEVIKAFLPKYAGLAVAVGDVAEAFKK